LGCYFGKRNFRRMLPAQNAGSGNVRLSSQNKGNRNVFT
jgi:hypothetical protein